jgi:hypothetical protein
LLQISLITEAITEAVSEYVEGALISLTEEVYAAGAAGVLLLDSFVFYGRNSIGSGCSGNW